MMPARACATLVASAVAFAACKHRAADSEVLVTNGAPAADEFPEVVGITRANGGLPCTGTFVGDTTVLTAAHCVTAGFKYYKGEAPQKTLVHPKYTAVGPYDLAILIFEVGTAPSVASISKRRPLAGDPLTIVGYGLKNEIADTGGGPKRKGSDVVAGIAGGQIRIVGVAAASSPTHPLGQDVAAGSGDSGGPLYIGGHVAGVTSAGFDSGEWNYSFYVDLTSDDSVGFLYSAVEQGATILGLDADSPPSSATPAGDRIDELDARPCTTTASCTDLLDRWEAELNRVHGVLQDALPAAEERATLKAAQQAWLAFRDRERVFLGAWVSIVPLRLRLYIARSRRRAVELSNYLNLLGARLSGNTDHELLPAPATSDPARAAIESSVAQCLAGNGGSSGDVPSSNAGSSTGSDDSCFADGRTRWAALGEQTFTALRDALDPPKHSSLKAAHTAASAFEAKELALIALLPGTARAEARPRAATEMRLAAARAAMLIGHRDLIH